MKMRNISVPQSGLVIESFPDPITKNEVKIFVYRGIPYADAERFGESVVRENIPNELPIIKGKDRFSSTKNQNSSNASFSAAK